MQDFSSPAPGPPHDHLSPRKVALYYGLAAATWIFLSDTVLSWFVRDPDQLNRLQTVKGGAFVVVSALLLYALARHYLQTLQRREAQLRASEESFRSVFLTAAAGMVVTRLDGTMVQANPAFCRFIGYSEAELAGLTITAVTHPDDREFTIQYFKKLATGREESVHYEKRYLTRDGRTVWGHASVACLLGEGEVAPYCIGLVQDISEHKEAEAALRQSNRELEAFAYTVSHDLRTPLTPIIGYADFLYESCRERLSAEELAYLAEISSAGVRMSTVMEDLLMLAKVGKLERPPAPFDPGAVVAAVLRARSAQIAADGVSVTVGALPDVRIPPTLLSQIFDNLLGNALRYGCRSGGQLEVSGERNGEKVRFSVRDHGPGIPLVERGRIFELFYRCAGDEAQQGTGIGLATVQKIARLYAGRAWVEETPGGGSTFRVELVDPPPGAV